MRWTVYPESSCRARRSKSRFAPRPPSWSLLRSRLRQRAPRPRPENPQAGAPSAPAAAQRGRHLTKSRAPSYYKSRKSRMSSILPISPTGETMAELPLDPQKTALVIIDLQNAILGMNPAPYSAAQVAENSKKLAEAFRAQGAPVVYVRVDLNDFLKLPVDQPPSMGDKALPAAASEIAAAAGFQPGDILITKRHWGAFAGTDLEQQLKSRGVDTVVLTGISSNAGVESTARQGTGLGFAFVLVEDACSAQDAEQHRFAFEKIFPRLTRVRTTAEVLAAFV